MPMSTDKTTVAIACQGGGSHTAFTAGVLKRLIADLPADHEVVGLSGTSGGAVCAATAWYGLLADDACVGDRLDSLWESLAARSIPDRTANEAGVLFARLESSGLPIPQFSPYDTPLSETGHAMLRRVIESHVEFDRIPDLLDDDSPRLTVSAVSVNDGQFKTFTDEAITVDALLASTAVPHLFQAVTLDGRPHWDGLFSQNPPIKNFLTDPTDVDEKPDALWIIQINPELRDETPRSLEAIVDRRNELAGNLSLRQEVDFIEQVNEWVADGSLDPDRYKRVDVDWIRLDEDLSVASKLDRDPGFITDLMTAGETAAAEFLG